MVSPETGGVSRNLVVCPETTSEETPEICSIWLKEDRGPRAAKVLTHQHPKPVAHPTMLDHVAMSDHLGNGEAGHLTEEGPLEHLKEGPVENADVSHRTQAPSSRK